MISDAIVSLAIDEIASCWNVMKITKQYHVAPSPTIQLIRQGTLTSVFMFLPNFIFYILWFLMVLVGLAWKNMKTVTT